MQKPLLRDLVFLSCQDLIVNTMNIFLISKYQYQIIGVMGTLLFLLGLQLIFYSKLSNDSKYLFMLDLIIYTTRIQVAYNFRGEFFIIIILSYINQYVLCKKIELKILITIMIQLLLLGIQVLLFRFEQDQVECLVLAILLIITLIWGITHAENFCGNQDVHEKNLIYKQDPSTSLGQVSRHRSMSVNLKQTPMFKQLIYEVKMPKDLEQVLDRYNFLRNEKILLLQSFHDYEMYELNFKFSEFPKFQQSQHIYDENEAFKIFMDSTVMKVSNNLGDLMGKKEKSPKQRVNRSFSAQKSQNYSQQVISKDSQRSNTDQYKRSKQKLRISEYQGFTSSVNLKMGDICQKLLEYELQKDIMNELYIVDQLDNQTIDFRNIQINMIIIEVKFKPAIILHFRPTMFFTSRTSFINRTQIMSEQILTNIFSSVSHEFGTYMNIMTTLSEMGQQDEEIDEKIRQSYFLPLKINTHLLNLIFQNIHDYNQMMKNQFFLKIDEFDIMEEIEKLISYMSIILKERSIIVYFSHSTPKEKFKIYNDKERFLQVFFQIFSNAVRFTNKGTIKIVVESQQLTNPRVESLQISVIDSGIGMSPSEQWNLNKLLDPDHGFTKVSQRSVGCGLGLTISNQICYKLNNSTNKGISYKSQESKGSTFSFSLVNMDSNQLNLQDSFMVSNDQQTKKYILRFLNSVSYVEAPSMFGIQKIVSNNMLGAKQFESKRTLKSNINQSNYNANKCQSVNHSYNSLNLVQQQIQSEMINQDLESEQNDHIIQIPNSNPKFKSSIIQYSIDQQCCTKILIVDDEYFNILTLEVILKRYHAKTDHAFHGKEALEKINQKQKEPCPKCSNKNYTVFFIDVNMPIMDGIETVILLKEMMKNGEIDKGYCIANTAFVDLETKVKCNEAGMDFYVAKPIKIQEIVEIFKKIFQNL